MLRTLLAFVTGVIAAVMWLERQTGRERPRSAATAPATAPAAPVEPAPAAPEPERVVEEVVVPDPEQSARIEALEAELAEERALRAPEPGEGHPGVDAIRAARTRALELERELSQVRDSGVARWFEVEAPSAEGLIDAAAEHFPNVAIWIEPDAVEPDELWRVLGAMQEFADASGGAWFEFEGDFGGWCAQSGHPHALDPELPGLDEERPTFTVEARVNRSGRMVVPNYVQVGERRLYWVNDVGGETGRMHVVGLA